MKPVHVLGRVDQIHDLVGIEAGGQRELNQYPIDLGVRVEGAYPGPQTFP